MTGLRRVGNQATVHAHGTFYEGMVSRVPPVIELPEPLRLLFAAVMRSPHDWADLHCAYGSAERVPDLLRRAEDPEDAAAWDELWGHLCHQGTVYSASFAAIPALAAICRQRGPHGYLEPLHLVASIIASDDGPPGAAALREQYAPELADLGTLAQRCVELAGDDVEFIYGLQTVAAFTGLAVWCDHLAGLAGGEVFLDCGGCGEHLLVDIEDLPATVTCWDGAGTPTTVVAAQDPTPAEARLIALADSNNRPIVAAKLRELFGQLTCPGCGATFRIDPALR